MKKIAVVGMEAFNLGFRLAGIKIMVNIQDRKSVLDRIHALKQNRDIGVVIIDGNVMESLESSDRNEIEESIEPVFVSLSSKDSSDNIRELIIKSMGVDLWKGG